MAKKPPKKTAKKTAPKKRKSAAELRADQLQAEVNDLNERLAIQKHLYASLERSVESERALGRALSASHVLLQQQFEGLSLRYDSLCKAHYKALEQIDDTTHDLSNLEGRVEGMMSAYQHAFETVTDNLSNNMVTMLSESAATPPQE